MNEELQRQMMADAKVQQLARQLFDASYPYKYSFNFTWLGRPIIQYPPDMIAIQEIIWDVKPDLIIETGIAHGGSLVFSASMLQLLGAGTVLGIDIDIREHNRAAIEAHPLAHRITMVEGSSTDPEIAARAAALAAEAQRVLVILDSNHTHEHVLRELELYAPLVTPGSYIIVLDTVIEFLPDGSFPDRPWDRGDNPWTAVQAFLKEHPEFSIDEGTEGKLLLTAGPGGYLKRARD